MLYVVLCYSHRDNCQLLFLWVSALTGGHSETEQSTLYGVQLPLHHHVLNTNQLQPTETQYIAIPLIRLKIIKN